MTGKRLAASVFAGVALVAGFIAFSTACTAVVSDGDYKVPSTCSASATDSACGACLKASCCVALAGCTEDPDCDGLSACIAACKDSGCTAACLSAHSATAVTELDAVTKCGTQSCQACGSNGAGLGDPCTQNTDCASQVCLGRWCSLACTHDTDCKGSFADGTNKFGQQNACITTQLNAHQCFPGCTTASDCASFPATQCLGGTSNDGAFVKVCSTVATDAGP